MSKIYLRQVLAGKITLDEIPERWREQVKEMLMQKEE